MTLESNLHLDGQIKGTVLSNHDVSVGHTGRFEGNIKAERLLVSGYVEGVVDCASLEIVAQGRVLGELHSDDFIIEPGGQFLGESRPRRQGPIAALSHQAEEEPPEEDVEAVEEAPEPKAASAPPPPEKAAAEAAAADQPQPEEGKAKEDKRERGETRHTVWGRR